MKRLFGVLLAVLMCAGSFTASAMVLAEELVEPEAPQILLHDGIWRRDSD